MLIDQNATKDGTAAQGKPWRYYDLGHGLCSYEFFERCPHRMACARWDFYVPKESARGQFMEAREGILRLVQEIPLASDQRAALDGDADALDHLLKRLAQTPPPSVGRSKP